MKPWAYSGTAATAWSPCSDMLRSLPCPEKQSSSPSSPCCSRTWSLRPWAFSRTEQERSMRSDMHIEVVTSSTSSCGFNVLEAMGFTHAPLRRTRMDLYLEVPMDVVLKNSMVGLNGEGRQAEWRAYMRQHNTPFLQDLISNGTCVLTERATAQEKAAAESGPANKKARTSALKSPGPGPAA